MFKRRKKIAYLGSTFGSAFHVWRMSLLYIISFLLFLKNCRNQKLNTLVQGGARNSLTVIVTVGTVIGCSAKTKFCQMAPKSTENH